MTIRSIAAAAFACAVALCLSSLPAFAHHSIAAFDMQNPITLKGVVARVGWTNPHTFIYVKVKDEKGNEQGWALELSSPDFLKHRGWTNTTVKPGDIIIFTGGPAKSGSKTIRCTTIELADGEKLRS